MKFPLAASLCLTMTMTAANTVALADAHDNHQYVHHDEWKKGSKIRDEDWQRGEHVDYHASHLRAPRHGYEWRQVDGNYVQASSDTGVITSVVAARRNGR